MSYQPPPNNQGWQPPPYPPSPNTYYPPQEQNPWHTGQYAPPPPQAMPPQNIPPYPQQRWQLPPPKKPVNNKRNTWIIIGAIILFMGIYGVARTSTSQQNATTAIEITATPLPTDTPTDIPTQAPTPSSHFKVGETVSTPDGYIVTINKTYTSTGSDFDTPTKGNQYLVVDVSVKNNTGQVQHMASSQFALVDSTGQRIDDTVVTLPNLHLFLGGTLQDGSTMRGQLVYEVPTGKHPYTFSYAGDIYSDIQTLWDIQT